VLAVGVVARVRLVLELFHLPSITVGMVAPGCVLRLLDRVFSMRVAAVVAQAQQLFLWAEREAAEKEVTALT
jgi:hypothetical protein